MRDAFKMQLKPNCVTEYRRRHDEIWPELVKAHTDCGISDYTIFLDEETLTLFAVRHLTKDNTADTMGRLDIVQKWWEYNKDLMAVEADNSPVFKPLVEIFHMD